MPITKGAQKAHSKSLRKRIFNLRRQRAVRDVSKKIDKALAGGEIDKAKELIPTAYKAIDKAAKRGVIKKNTANRKKARLVAQIGYTKDKK